MNLEWLNIVGFFITEDRQYHFDSELYCSKPPTQNSEQNGTANRIPTSGPDPNTQDPTAASNGDIHGTANHDNHPAHPNSLSDNASDVRNLTLGPAGGSRAIPITIILTIVQLRSPKTL
ncbi:MAG: hypothetical protein MMC33_007322 [Icmadophila ericetorum]|nr:hypothetical protein [Icmadophila ericetorum]